MLLKFGRQSFSFQNIVSQTKNHTLLIQLNRPKALNALCSELFQELNQEVSRANLDDQIRTIIITGNEKAFAAGADIKEMVDKQYSQVYQEKFLESWNQLTLSTKPIIAAVSGFALGGGFELALMCDIIVCSPSAKFGLPELKLGTIPGGGGTQRLIREVGKSKAMEMILTSEFIGAEEALKLGLVSRVTDNPVEEAQKIADKINKKSLITVAKAKECVNKAYELDLKNGLDYEKRVFWSTFATKDREIGMKAFVSKQEPQFIDK